MSEHTREHYHTGNPSIDFILQRISDRLDQIEGRRDYPTFFKSRFDYDLTSDLTVDDVLTVTAVDQAEPTDPSLTTDDTVSDNEVARWDGDGGDKLKGSNVTIDNDGSVTIPDGESIGGSTVTITFDDTNTDIELSHDAVVGVDGTGADITAYSDVSSEYFYWSADYGSLNINTNSTYTLGGIKIGSNGAADTRTNAFVIHEKGDGGAFVTFNANSQLAIFKEFDVLIYSGSDIRLYNDANGADLRFQVDGANGNTTVGKSTAGADLLAYGETQDRDMLWDASRMSLNIYMDGDSDGINTPGVHLWNAADLVVYSDNGTTAACTIDGTTGSITLTNDADIILGTGNGTVIGTATSQKLALWAATPIEQPTNAIAEAAFVENAGGTNVNDDSTFGGYTLRQVVQALQNVGILA